MVALTRLMNSMAGRVARAFLGVVLLVIGVRLGTGGGYAIAAVGVLLVGLGVSGHCLLEAVSGSARSAMRRP
jgi:hypothetical protein